MGTRSARRAALLVITCLPFLSTFLPSLLP